MLLCEPVISPPPLMGLCALRRVSEPESCVPEEYSRDFRSELGFGASTIYGSSATGRCGTEDYLIRDAADGLCG